MNLSDKISILENKITNSISLVASESLLHPNIKKCLSSISHQLTVEGNYRKRYFPVPSELNEIEYYTNDKLSKLFGSNYCDIRPTTATHANIAVFMSSLNYGDNILSLNLNDGGHISHGHNLSFLNRFYNIIHYSLLPNGSISLKELKSLLCKYKPKLVISGGSSCPRNINHDSIAQISHSYNALHLADISHTAGLIAADIIPNTLMSSDFITFGTQKTFLGPRGGVVLCKNKFIKNIDKSIFPGMEGAMLIPQILAKSMAASFATTEEFVCIQKKILKLSKLLVKRFKDKGIKVITDGSDNHIVLIDIPNAKYIVDSLFKLSIRYNLNPIPNSSKWGIRFGTTSIAQSQLDYNMADILFQQLVNFCLNPKKKTPKNKLQEIIKEIIRNELHTLQNVDDGNFIYTDTNVNKRDEITSKNLIVNKNTLFKPYIPIVNINKSFLNLNKIMKDKCTVIIPTIEYNNKINQILSYINNILKDVDIYVIDKSLTKERVITLDKNIKHISLKNIAYDIFDIKKLQNKFEFDINIHSGKGFSMYIGYILSIAKNKENIFYIDDDLEDLNIYDPLNKLIFASQNKCDLALIATPKRRNEIIHGVLNALKPDYPAIIDKLLSIIHFLCGERYLKINKYLNFPWLTNYGIETWINIFSVNNNFMISQISNTSRKDAINSYVKNESMLMYCSKLIAILMKSNVIKNSDNKRNIIDFNKILNSENEISILPTISNKSNDFYYINSDKMLPSYNYLKQNKFISNINLI